MDSYEVVRDDFWSRVHVGGQDECWPWSMSTANHGYGQWVPRSKARGHLFSRNHLAHRLAWFFSRGPIPPSWTIDHLCRNRTCCNPAHLRLLTNSANGRLNGHAIKSACPAGHPYDERNTYVEPATGHRQCRECTRMRHTRQRQNKETNA